MKRIFLKSPFLITVGVLVFVLSSTLILAAPSGQVDVESDNILELGDSQEVVITFENTADTAVTDVASTVQFIAISAANLNPTRTAISLSADWEIWESETAADRRAWGTVGASGPSSEIYAPYSTTSPIDLYTWALGEADGSIGLSIYTNSSQFEDDLKILRPGELFKLKITVNCLDIVGDSRIWFFFKATEFEPSTTTVSDIAAIPESQRMNLYYSKAPGSDQTPYWWPLHNSYDPYDADLDTGHNFEQHSWNKGGTTNAYAKSNKLVHQKPGEATEQEIFSFHICGAKFWDSNYNRIYDLDIESGIDGVSVVLLGPDQATKAEDWYGGMFDLVENEDNPLNTGENGLVGSYCFNLENVKPGSYTFYLKEEMPLGWMPVTPETIGPFTLEASEGGPREWINNNFGNVPNISEVPPGGRTVGGYIYPVNKTRLLTPWIILTAAILAVGIVLVRRRSNSYK
ncbi:hypothetical protein ACFLWZ_05720 [Chloroflexota bacterium]